MARKKNDGGWAKAILFLFLFACLIGTWGFAMNFVFDYSQEPCKNLCENNGLLFMEQQRYLEQYELDNDRICNCGIVNEDNSIEEKWFLYTGGD